MVFRGSLDDTKKTEAAISFATLETKEPLCYDSVVMDRFIYCFGANSTWRGSYRPRGKKLATESKQRKSNGRFVWEECPPMSNSFRIVPAVSAVAGKIYVLGGCTRDDPRYTSFGEVYDPESNSWEAQREPEQVTGSVHLYAVVENRILMCFGGLSGLYEFHVGNQSWVCLDPEFDRPKWGYMHWLGPVPVVDHCLLVHREGNHFIFGYDFYNRKWLPKPVWTPPKSMTDDERLSNLIQAGNGKVCYTLESLSFDEHGEKLVWNRIVECRGFDVHMLDRGKVKVSKKPPIKYFFKGTSHIYFTTL